MSSAASTTYTICCSWCGKEWRHGRRCCGVGYAVTAAEYEFRVTLIEIRGLPETASMADRELVQRWRAALERAV